MQIMQPAVVAISPLIGFTAIELLFFELMPITFSSYIYTHNNMS